MRTFPTQPSDGLMGIIPLLVLGAGFVALFAGFDYFYVIWIIGFTVFVPMIAIFLDGNEEREGDEWSSEDTQHETEPDGTTAQSSSSATQDAISTLRERYANGDLTDEQFEQKLDKLLETETPENAAEWREKT